MAATAADGGGGGGGGGRGRGRVAAKPRRSVSDAEDERDDSDDGKRENPEDKEGLKTADKDEQQQYNAYICFQIDQTWVSDSVYVYRLDHALKLIILQVLLGSSPIIGKKQCHLIRSTTT